MYPLLPRHFLEHATRLALKRNIPLFPSAAHESRDSCSAKDRPAAFHTVVERCRWPHSATTISVPSTLVHSALLSPSSIRKKDVSLALDPGFPLESPCFCCQFFSDSGAGGGFSLGQRQIITMLYPSRRCDGQTILMIHTDF